MGGSLATKLSLISTLARYGFTADVRSTVDGWTPLLAAVELGSLELVAALTKLGARLTADRHVGLWDRGDGGPEGRQCFGDPPMVMAVRGQGSIASLLFKPITLLQ